MICNNCKSELAEGSAYCPYCGAPQAKQEAQPQQSGEQQQWQHYTMPEQPGAAGQQGAYGPYAQPFYPQPASNAEVDSAHTLGLVALIVGIFIPLVGFICGGIGLSKVKKLRPRSTPEQQQKLEKSKKLCLSGIIVPLVLSIISVIISVVWGTYIAGKIITEFEKNNNNNSNSFYFDGGEPSEDMREYFEQYGIEFDEQK